MATIYEKADDEVSQLAEEIIEKHFAVLKAKSVRIDYLFATNRNGPALKLHGRTAYGIARLLNLKDRKLRGFDVEIALDAFAWHKFSDGRKRALLHHELTHFEPVIGDKSRDQLGRPKVTMRQHDFEFGWFLETARIYGRDSFEVLQANHLLHGEHGGTLFQPDLFRIVEEDETATFAAA